jgi:iron complex outermembrane receptor protein
MMTAMPARAEVVSDKRFSIQAQPLGDALTQLARDSGREIVYSADLVRGKQAQALNKTVSFEVALSALLKGTGLAWHRNDSGTILIVPAETRGAESRGERVVKATANRPQPVTQTEDTAVQQVIVTARRKEEKIIDVPIAASAFSGQQLNDRKVEGGSELLRAIPNVSYSKDNFTGYNFSIRSIGTKAISVTTDPTVAVSFNNTALLRNCLNEQEYFDVQRVEVLRGPQGTLYGRNATAGVVNMLPNLPELGVFSGELQAEVGNYDARRMNGFINLPLGDKFAVRLAAAGTQRSGYDYNTVTQQNVNGRDLWSTRLGALWKPNDRLSLNFLWEHFNEADDRSRTGKQLCTRGDTPGSLTWTDPDGNAHTSSVSPDTWTGSSLTPGCQAKSLYSDAASALPMA